MTFVNIFWHLLTLINTFWHPLTLGSTCQHLLTLVDTHGHLSTHDTCWHWSHCQWSTSTVLFWWCAFTFTISKYACEQTNVKHIIKVWADLILQTEQFLKILTFFQYNLFKTMQAYSVSIKQFSLIYQHLSCELLCRDYIGQLLPT